MRKLIVVLLLLVLVFGCAKQADQESLKDTVDKTTKQPSVTVEETEEKTQEPITPVETEATEPETSKETEAKPKPTTKTIDSSTELGKLLAKIDKVFSVKYTYGEPPRINEIDTYWVQNKDISGKASNLIKIGLYEYEPTRLEDYWDTAYLNTAEKKAKVYCLDRTLCQSKNLDKRTETKEVKYEDYKKKTPFEWAKEIPSTAKIVGPELIDGRTVTRFAYTGTDGRTYDMWLDNTYGIPLQVTTMVDGEKYEYSFRDISFNIAKDEDFKPPF